MKSFPNVFYYFLSFFIFSLPIIFVFSPISALSQEKNQREKEMIEALSNIRSDIQRINKDLTDINQSILRMNEKIKDYQVKNQVFENSISSVLSDIGGIRKILDSMGKEIESLKTRPDLSGKVEYLEKKLNLLSASLKFLFGGLLISFFFSFLSLILSIRQGKKARRGLRF